MRYIAEICIPPVWCSVHTLCLDKKWTKEYRDTNDFIFPSVKKENCKDKKSCNYVLQNKEDEIKEKLRQHTSK